MRAFPTRFCRRLCRRIVLRLVLALVVLWTIASASFFLVRAAPGGPFDQSRRLPESVRANVERHWGLSRPLAEQYLGAMEQMARLDFGPSLENMGRYRVGELIARGLPVSMELGLYAIVFALLVGVGAGVFGANRPGTLADHAVTAFALTGFAVPSIVLAPLLIIVFSVWLGWLPLSGWESWQSRILPAVSLGMVYAAAIARITRSGVEEALSRDFVRAARARGLAERTVLRRHVLRVGLVPLVSFLGPALASVLTGSIVVERLFHIPGIAEHFVASAQARDYPMVLGVVVVYSGLLLVLNLVADVVHTLLDPRVGHGDR